MNLRVRYPGRCSLCLQGWLVVLLISSCGGESGPSGVAGPAPGVALIVSFDPASLPTRILPGTLSLFDSANFAFETVPVDDFVVGADPYVRVFGDSAYIVNRVISTITIVDLVNFPEFELVPTRPEPQDVAVYRNKLYVAVGRPGVQVFDLADPAAEPTEIELSTFDPEDSVSDPSSIHVVGNRVFVALRRLDGIWEPRGNGVIAVIDADTDTLVDSFELATSNPNTLLVKTPDASAFGGDFVVGTWGPPVERESGCLQRFSEGGASTCLVSNETLGGFVSAVAYDPVGDQLLVNVIDADVRAGITRLVAVDSTGGVRAALEPESQRPTDVEICSTGDVVVVDLIDLFDPSSGGLRVYGPGLVERTSSVIDVGLPPAPAGGVACL